MCAGACASLACSNCTPVIDPGSICRPMHRSVGLHPSWPARPATGVGGGALHAPPAMPLVSCIYAAACYESARRAGRSSFCTLQTACSLALRRQQGLCVPRNCAMRCISICCCSQPGRGTQQALVLVLAPAPSRAAGSAGLAPQDCWRACGVIGCSRRSIGVLCLAGLLHPLLARLRAAGRVMCGSCRGV